MRFFQFRKWFFDVSAGVEDYLILFVSEIRLGRHFFASLQMHGTDRISGGGFNTGISLLKTIHQTGNGSDRMIFDEGEIFFENGNCRIRLDFGDTRISLDYTGKEVSWPPAAAFCRIGKESLDWRPLILQGQVYGDLSTIDGIRSYTDASGYIDEVISNFRPWKAPLSRLFWGRMHSPEASLTYSIMQNPGGHRDSSRLFLDFQGGHYVLDYLQIEYGGLKASSCPGFSYPDQYLIKAEQGDLSVRLEIGRHQEMIINDFMGYEEEYGRVGTAMLRWISKNPKGIKFLATAKLEILRNGIKYTVENAQVVDEYVEFR